MGLFDEVTSLLGGAAEQGGGVLGAVQGLIAEQGGLSGLVDKLHSGGLSDQVKSWIGNGQNLPITAEQLQQVLGSDTVRQLAAKYNIPVDQITQILAQQLPAAVDHASPDGKLPQTA